MVWAACGSTAFSMSQRRTCLPVPSYRMTETAPVITSRLRLHRQPRSGSTTGCAVVETSGRTAWSMAGFQSSRWPTSAMNSSVTGSTSTGRPASQVANRRSPHGSGAVLAALTNPQGELVPTGPAVNWSGRLARSRTDGVSMTRARHAKRPAGAPSVPGRSDSRAMIPSPKKACRGRVRWSDVLTTKWPRTSSGQVPAMTSRSRSATSCLARIERGIGIGASGGRFPVNQHRRPLRSQCSND